MEEYYAVFQKKTLKKVHREIDRMYQRDLTIHKDDLNDFKQMVILNIKRFGTLSFFADNRFVKSFRVLKDYLHQKGQLKMITVLIDGQVVAVDMGCIYDGVYTILFGGTHPDYPGIAEVINFIHMEKI